MADYPIPPWLHGVSAGQIASLYSSGMQLGAQIADEQARLAQATEMQQQRLQQEKEVAQMQADARSKVAAQTAAMQQQRIAMEQAYHDQTISLHQTQLAEKQQEFQAKAKMAAGQFAAQQRASQRIAAGEDPAKVWLEEGPAAGAIGGTMGAAAMRLRSMGDAKPSTAVDVPGAPGYFQVPSPTGRGYQIHPKRPGPDEIKQLTAAQAATVLSKIPELSDQLGTNYINQITPLLKKKISEGLTPRTVKRNPDTNKLELVPAQTSQGTDDEEED